jgi:hypothetical protein
MHLPSSMLRRVLVILLLAYSVYTLRANYFIEYQENYRDAFAYLVRHSQERDGCIFLPFREVPMQWTIYQDNQPLNVTTLEEALTNPADFKRIWLVSYHRTQRAVEQAKAGKHRLETAYVHVERQRYFWVDLDLYVPK